VVGWGFSSSFSFILTCEPKRREKRGKKIEERKEDRREERR
jgi:hypothetical protein